MLILLISIICAIFPLKWLIENFVRSYYALKLPGPAANNRVVGSLRLLATTQDKNFQFLREWSSQYYPAYALRVGPVALVALWHPEDIGLILGDPKHNEKNDSYNVFSRWLKEGLLVSSGKKWFQRRKMLTPAFHFTILQDFILTFNERTDELVEILKNVCHKPHTKITGLITNFALATLAETAMGVKFDLKNEKEKMYLDAVHKISDLALYRVFQQTHLLYDCFYLFSMTYFRELKFLKILHTFTREVIQKREKILEGVSSKKRKRLAMLDLLLAKKKEGEIDDEGIREEVDTFIYAGHDTTSTALSFGLMLIACHPNIQEEIVREMSDVLGDIKKRPNYNDLQELKFMERCIKEIMRIYPSVHYIGRKNGEDIILHSGQKIKKNTQLLLMIYDVHHDPNTYPDPEKFDPDRFLPENCKNRHPYAYIPFSAGARNCVGQKFAMLELKTVFCRILANFILEPVDTPETIILCSEIVLRNKDEIKVKFVPREK